MIYLKNFSSEEEYNAYMAGNPALPNTSKVISGGTHYTPLIPAGPEFVDLGLSVNWAKCNIGANSETEYGGFYGWGEVETKDYYFWDTYKYCTPNYSPYPSTGSLLKYTSTDNKIVLEDEDEIVKQSFHSENYRMPTKTECEELFDATKIQREVLTENDVLGVKFTSLVSGHEGNYIFIPIARYTKDSISYDFGGIWTVNIQNSASGSFQQYSTAFCLITDHDASKVRVSYFNRYYGFSIRPVQVK